MKAPNYGFWLSRLRGGVAATASRVSPAGIAFVATLVFMAAGPKHVTTPATSSSDTRNSKRSVQQNIVSPSANPRSQPVRSAPDSSGRSSTSLPSGGDIGLEWISINGGGATDVSSGDNSMSVTVGQSLAGQTSSANSTLGSGFWYGKGTRSCSCLFQGDINGDNGIDVFDVIAVIGIAFSGDSDIQDLSCPKTRSDVNNDGAADVFDVIYLIATAFGGGASPIDPCNP